MLVLAGTRDGFREKMLAGRGRGGDIKSAAGAFECDLSNT